MSQAQQDPVVQVSRSPKVVVCIPAYNEENRIGPVIIKALKYVDKVIVCDDGSKDLTGRIAASLGASVITHERNMGYGAALRSLFNEARRLNAEYVVTLDGDGQHDPADISKLINGMESGDYDIVVGSRFVEGAVNEAPSWRTLGIQFITKLISREKELTDSQSGFRAYNQRALEVLVLTESGMGASTEILIKAANMGLRVGEIGIDIKYNYDSSKRNPILHGLDVLISTLKHMSINRPLMFYGVPGTISLLVSLYFWIWNIQVFTETGTIITNPAIIAIGTSIVGLMLLTTSIILWVVVTVIREKN